MTDEILPQPMPPEFQIREDASTPNVGVKIPEFRILAGVGGVFVYLLGSLPLVIVTMLYVASTQPASKSTEAISDEVDKVISSPVFLAGILLFQCLAFLVYALLVSFIRGTGNLINDLGLKFTWSALLFIPAGFLLQFVGIFMNVPISLLRDERSEQEVLTSFKSSSGISILILALLFSIVVPIVEEICFRGLFQRGLQKRFSPYITVLLSGFIFAVVHFADPNAILGGPVLMMMGIFAAALATYRGRIDASICLHIGFNMTTVLLIIIAQIFS